MDMNNLNLSQALGLLTTGAGLLEGQGFGQAVQGGLGAYSQLNQIQQLEEERRRKEAQRVAQQRLATAAQMGGVDMAGRPVDMKGLAMAAAPKVAAEQLIRQQFAGADDRIIRNVAGVGLVDATNPNDPKVIVPAKKQESDSRRNQNLGPYVNKETGEYIGEGTMDRTTGERYIETPTGRIEIDPTKYEPRTEGFLGKGVLEAGAFRKLRGDLVDDERGLRQLTSYLKNVEQAPIGLERLAADFASKAKTFFSTNAKRLDLTPEQVALRTAQNQLQGLVGLSRLETVGPGVLTEQDAQRVVAYLGGDVTLLQNPQLVKEAISRVFQEKYLRYTTNLEDYNANVRARYGALRYEPKEALVFDTSLLSAETVANIGLGGEPTGLNQLTDEQLFQLKPASEEERKRIEEEYERRGY